MTAATKLLGGLHEGWVLDRRARVLAGHLAACLPAGARILDVGCGDGKIGRLILSLRPDVTIEGIDVLVRPITDIPVRAFDGTRIPFDTQCFDVVQFVDVLHHTVDPLVLLREAMRVGRLILIKDHYRDGILAEQTLRLMDWVGNSRHGVGLTYNYWSKAEWAVAFERLGLTVVGAQTSLGLYPPPASWIFGRRLHFINRLEH